MKEEKSAKSAQVREGYNGISKRKIAWFCKH